MKTISQLQYITHDLEEVSHVAQATRACEAGINWIQLRVKNKDHASWKKIALTVNNICKKFNTTLIINDNVELAKEINADGVHLGKEDMNPLNARKVLGNNYIIGGTANTLEDIINLNSQGVDYIGLGPYKSTTTKKKLAPLLGVSGYSRLIEKCIQLNIKTPIVAIGGIAESDAQGLMKTGVHGLACSSAINNSKNLKETILALSKWKN